MKFNINLPYKNLMEFILESVNSNGRIGMLNFDSLNFPTPNFMLSSKAGSVPYVSIDILEDLKILPTFIQMPIDGLIINRVVIHKYDKGVNNFTALQGSPIYCCVHDSSVQMNHGFNDARGIALWGKSGKIQVNADSYMDFIEDLCPILFQSLCDAATDETSSKKRIRKSVNYSIDYLERCISRLNDSKKLRDSKIIGSIVGGFDMKERVRCATEVQKLDVFGYSFDGFDMNIIDLSSSKFHSILNLISATLPLLDERKLRILPGILNLRHIIEAAQRGIDIFDSSYAYALTERNCALNLHFDYRDNEKNRKNNEFIVLSDKMYFEDFSRISTECVCYTCKKYSRSYLHHLVVTKELLAPILLFIHNIHQFQSFFHHLRDAIQMNELHVFQNYLFNDD